ncbi:MAG: HD domain-containing protein [Pseudobutyrivibrio sp.]|nr:HD domain-containing protein [Pseudobutyrivibrio sp.]
MTNERINEIKHNTKVRFAEYTRHYDMSQPKIALKAAHTYRVADFCQQIARSIGLSEEEVLVAWMTGMLHDISRFEQVRRFDTFYDSLSVNHAMLSCEILWGTSSMPHDLICTEEGFPEKGIIREFIEETKYDNIIRAAIWEHNTYRISEGLDEKTVMFCNILRDADKVDIFRVNTETPLNEIHNVPIEEFYNSEVTDEVMDSFMEHHCVLSSLKKTAIDNVVGYASLYWELVYEKSKELAMEQGYLNKLCNIKTNNEKARACFETVRKELGLE